MLRKKSVKKVIPIAIGMGFVLFSTSLLFFNSPFLQNSLKHFQNISYDLMVRWVHRPIEKPSSIVIVDIDNESLSKEGRWPWNRKKMGKLVTQIYDLGARVAALDIIFPEVEENQVDVFINALKQEKSSSQLPDLQSFRHFFDYDVFFARGLSSGNSSLGFAFINEEQSQGRLPAPVLTVSSLISEELFIPEKKGYLSNITILEKAAKTAGFINSSPDSDGVLRYSPLILKYREGIYPSLGLAAARLFLNNPPIRISVEKYKGEDIVEGVFLGEKKIPTDSTGRILIPFRGGPYSIPYVSASDVLDGNISKNKLDGKLVFIGSSATALGDLVATAISPVFAGVEVHAQIASGILDGYLPYKPVWEKGIRVALLLGIGLSLALVLPFLGPIISTGLLALLSFGLGFLGFYFWNTHQIVLPIVFPLATFVFLYIFNGIIGYVFEKNRRRELKSVFGQYVPAEYIDQMLEETGNFGMHGEERELTVLFADIRNFTTISEKLSAKDLRAFLNTYLSLITEVIFESKGTIDKYIGDMVVAFWGAPLPNQDHAVNAVSTALSMQQKLASLDQQFLRQNQLELHIGIGVNTGSMNVGEMGSKYRKAYTVLGDAVNLGSRLEALTTLYKVKTLVGENCFEKTKDFFAFRKVDRVIVTGKSIPCYIYEPMCVKTELTQEISTRLELHQKGLEAYMSQRWDEAEAVFLQLKDKDPLYDIYLSRIAQFRKEPPKEDWDGTTTFTSK